MQNDQLLQKWKDAKQICWRVVNISREAHILGKVQLKLTKIQYMGVYDVVYQLCVTKEKQENRIIMVYKQFQEILKKAINMFNQDILHQRDICKLDLARKIWLAYTDSLKKLIHMFAYLNRPFHIKDGKIEELDKTGLDILFNTIFNDLSIKQLQIIYFREIDKIRQTSIISNAQILRAFVDILYTRHIKQQKQSKKTRTIYLGFHANFSKASRQHYKIIFKKIKELSPAQYFRQIKKMFEFELQIVQNCFGMLGQALFVKQFSQELLQNYKPILLGPRGLTSILKNKQVQTLKTIIDMFRKLARNVDSFKSKFQEFVYEQIREYMAELRTQILTVKNRTNYCSFMQKLIKKNQQFLYILEESFAQLGDFLNYYKSGVEKAFKDTPLQISIEEILALYVDTKLKSSTIREDQLGEQVRNVLSIFTCLQNKDLFLKKYTSKLAKRMILSSDPLSNHQSFIDNLKLNCGMKYTECLETLLVQLALSNQNKPLIDEITDNYSLGFTINLKIFSLGAWPTQKFIDIPIQLFPLELQRGHKCIQIFQNEHAKKKSLKISYAESRIRWKFYLEKEAGNTNQQCYLDTNTIQGVIFHYIYSQRPLQVHSKFLEQYFESIPANLIKENLDMLSECPEKIILKIKRQDQTFYQFNKLLKTKKRLINLDMINNEDQQRLFQIKDLGKDRQLVIDANISKIMKSKKIVHYQNLQHEILKMVKVFVPTRKDIKNSVERLINKDILSRDQQDINTLKYAD